MNNTVSQAANALMMIRPVKFCFNSETAVDNAFQKPSSSDGDSIQAKACEEFDSYVDILRSKGVEVATFEDTPYPHTPDSIFCNNWISFHDDGTIVLYPMKALNRRCERRRDIIEGLKDQYSFNIQNEIDFTNHESDELFLEGTGSIIFDYVNRIAYAAVSQRTNKELLEEVCKKLGYKAHTFRSVDENGKEIYHTNVMMCLADKYAMVCAQSIPDPLEREALLQSFMETGHEVVLLTYQQINAFAGNALQVKGSDGKTLLIVSKQGYVSLTDDQKRVIEQTDEIIPIPLETIETNGGGSARCMIADIRLPKKN